MSFLRNLDLYKVIVLVSILLLPVAGFWIWSLHAGIEVTRRAITEATRPGGLIEEIGALERQMETVVKNRTGHEVASGDASTYFEGVILKSGLGISRDDFGITKANPVNASIGRDQRVTDLEVEVTFGKQGTSRNDFPLGRDFLWNVLYLSEQQIWKLRTLDIVNATPEQERTFTARKTPPPELQDKWIVRNLKFVRRMPSKER